MLENKYLAFFALIAIRTKIFSYTLQLYCYSVPIYRYIDLYSIRIPFVYYYLLSFRFTPMMWKWKKLKKKKKRRWLTESIDLCGFDVYTVYVCTYQKSICVWTNELTSSTRLHWSNYWGDDAWCKSSSAFISFIFFIPVCYRFCIV